MIDKKFTIEQYIQVTVDESKFTEEFMEEYRQNFFSFYTVDEHMEYLAELFASGIIEADEKFIEGYGDPREFGIKLKSNGSHIYKES